MRTKKISLINKLGLHTRASSKLVDLASRFGSEIIIHCQDRKANAKSIMEVMVLGASQHSELHICVEGEDEIEALAAIEGLILNRFGEPE